MDKSNKTLYICHRKHTRMERIRPKASALHGAHPSRMHLNCSNRAHPSEGNRTPWSASVPDALKRQIEVNVSSFFQEEDPTPPNPRSYEAFGPKPQSLAEIAEKAKLDHGENSFEYASALVKLGDAHMVQGRLANPRAQECYETALQIVQRTDNSLAETAFVLDKLATVKHSSGDTAGAATDLKSAMELWQLLAAEARFVTDTYISRRAEDLERMEKVVAFENIRPPEL